MGQRRGGHAHLALRLGTVQAGHVPLGEQAAPGRVGDDHQLGDQLVERTAALALADVDGAGLGVGDVTVDRKVVVIDALDGRRLATAPLAGIGEMPQMHQFVAEGAIGQRTAHRFGVEPGLDFVMAKVGRDMHHLQPRFVGNDLETLVNGEVERDRRTVDTAGQGVVFDHRVGQHRDLVARHVDRRQTGSRHPVEWRTVRDGQARCRDVDADAGTEAGKQRHRQRIIDFGSVGVVDREGTNIGARQVVGRRRRVEGRKPGTLRKLLVQETAEVQEVGRPDRAAAKQQLRRRQAGFRAGRLERLRFRAVAVRRIEECIGQHADFRWQPECLQLGDPALHGQRLLALFLEAGECGGENVRRCLAKAPLALAMEVDRGGVQRQQNGARLDRRRVVAVVVAGEIEEGKLAFAGALPEEIGLDLFGQRCRLFEQGTGRRLLEAQQHRGRLDLAALARGHFDLQRRVVVGHDVAGLEPAVFFEQYIHRRIITPRIQ